MSQVYCIHCWQTPEVCECNKPELFRGIQGAHVQLAGVNRLIKLWTEGRKEIARK